MERYVSFETAKMLKDAGFDEPCGAHYEFCEGELRYKYAAPSQALAAKWLRKEHNLHVYSTLETSVQKWFYVIVDFSDTDYKDIVSESKYSSYEEALEEGLQTAIAIIG